MKIYTVCKLELSDFLRNEDECFESGNAPEAENEESGISTQTEGQCKCKQITYLLDSNLLIC